MTPPRRPSDTIPIPRAAIVASMVDRGELVECPACKGDGAVHPQIAKRVTLALPLPREAPTMPELPDNGGDDEG